MLYYLLNYLALTGVIIQNLIIQYCLKKYYGVAEHWVNLIINIFNFNQYDIPSDNADTSNEKEKCK